MIMYATPLNHWTVRSPIASGPDPKSAHISCGYGEDNMPAEYFFGLKFQLMVLFMYFK